MPTWATASRVQWVQAWRGSDKPLMNMSQRWDVQDFWSILKYILWWFCGFIRYTSCLLERSLLVSWALISLFRKIGHHRRISRQVFRSQSWVHLPWSRCSLGVFCADQPAILSGLLCSRLQWPTGSAGCRMLDLPLCIGGPAFKAKWRLGDLPWCPRRHLQQGAKSFSQMWVASQFRKCWKCGTFCGRVRRKPRNRERMCCPRKSCQRSPSWRSEWWCACLTASACGELHGVSSKSLQTEGEVPADGDVGAYLAWAKQRVLCDHASRVSDVGTDSCLLASLICDQQDSVLLFCYLQQRTVVWYFDGAAIDGSMLVIVWINFMWFSECQCPSAEPSRCSFLNRSCCWFLHASECFLVPLRSGQMALHVSASVAICQTICNRIHLLISPSHSLLVSAYSHPRNLSRAAEVSPGNMAVITPMKRHPRSGWKSWEILEESCEVCETVTLFVYIWDILRSLLEPFVTHLTHSCNSFPIMSTPD